MPLGIIWEGWTSDDTKPGDLPIDETEMDYGNVHDFLIMQKSWVFFFFPRKQQKCD